MRSEELSSQQRPQKQDRVQEWDTCHLSKRVSSLALPEEKGVEEGGSKEGVGEEEKKEKEEDEYIGRND